MPVVDDTFVALVSLGSKKYWSVVSSRHKPNVNTRTNQQHLDTNNANSLVALSSSYQ